MAIDKLLIGGAALLAWLIYSYVVYPFYLSPFAHVPGPKLAAMSRWWIRCVDFGGHRAATIDALHRKYGKIVRVAPNEISFTGQEAMQKIYGAGSPFEKPPHFYNIFIAYLVRSERKLTVGMDVVHFLQFWTALHMPRERNYSHKCIRNHLSWHHQWKGH